MQFRAEGETANGEAGRETAEGRGRRAGAKGVRGRDHDEGAALRPAGVAEGDSTANGGTNIPCYDYSCRLGHTTESREGYDTAKIKCPRCGGAAYRLAVYREQGIVTESAPSRFTVAKEN